MADPRGLGLHYVICNPNFDQSDLLGCEWANRIYDFWKGLWQMRFDDTGSPDPNWPDDFFRAPLVLALTTGQEVVACHLVNYFNLYSLAAWNSSYLQLFETEHLARWREKGLNHIMSIEYLCVSSSFRMVQSGVSLADVLISLATNLVEDRHWDLVLGTPIRGTRIRAGTEAMGWDSLPGEISKFGYTLEPVVFDRHRHQAGYHPDPVVREWIRLLWSQRQDWSKQDRQRERAA